MKVNSNITFQGLYTNKTFKKGLEFAAENGALFSAATIFGCSVGVRPLSIWMTPQVDKENKKVLCAKSIASSLAGYLMMFGISNLLLHNIIFIPVLLATCVSGMKLYKSIIKNREKMLMR